MLTLLAAASSLVLRPAAPLSRSSTASMMALVDDFSISKVVKDVRVYDGDYAADIRAEVATVAQASIMQKGSFSLAVPGGSVVSALGGFAGDEIDFSKVHVFFCNEKIPSMPCLSGALEVTSKIGIPESQVYGVGEGTPAEIAASYTALLTSHESVDNSGPMPSVDMMLLGTGGDGHCGCLFPESAEIKATGSGAVVVAGNDERADGDFVAVTLDVMNAAKVVLISAAGSGRAPMVAKALSGDFGAYDCPAGMVEGAEDTLWFTDTEGLAEFDSEGGFEDEDEEA